MKRYFAFLLAIVMIFACVPVLAEEAQWSFQAQTGELKLKSGIKPEGEIEIPAEIDGIPVYSMGYAALSFFPGVTKVSFADGIRFFDRNVLQNMDGLKEISLPATLIGIGAQSISRCSKLEKLTVPASVSFLDKCISSNSRLKEIVFEGVCPVIQDPDQTLVNLHRDCVIFVPDDQVDAYKSALAHLADRIKGSGKKAVSVNWTAKESEIEFDASTGTVTGYTGTAARVDIPAKINGTAVKVIGKDAFKKNTALYFVTIPEGVETVEDSAFMGCSKLTYAHFPSTLKTIEKTAFTSSGLLKVHWGKALESIENSAFSYTKLTDITLPDSLKYIGEKAFNCSALKTVSVGAGIESIGDEAFASNPLAEMRFDLYRSFEWGENVFKNCTSSAVLILPDDCSLSVYNAYAAVMKTQFPACQVKEPASPMEEVKILVQPCDVTVPEGMEATVQVEASGEGISYTWYFKNAGDKEYSKSTVCFDHYYQAEMNKARDGRQVYCVVTDKSGASVQSDTVTLHMGNGVAISRQSGKAAARPGEQATVYVEAEGENLTYTWYYKDSWEKEFNLSGNARGNTYTAEMNDARNGRQVYCIIKDANGNCSKTEIATLSMKEGSVKLLKLLNSASGPIDGTVTVVVNAEGEELVYAWYYKNAGDTQYVLSTSFTGKAYSVTMNENRNGRKIYCVITDKDGNSVETNTVTLSIETKEEAAARKAAEEEAARKAAEEEAKRKAAEEEAARKAEEEARKHQITILSQPSDAAAFEGTAVSVTVNAEGEGLSYSWYYKDSWENAFQRSNTAKGNTYTAEMSAARNGRQIYCVIANRYGDTLQTAIATLRMIPKTAVIYSASVKGFAGPVWVEIAIDKNQIVAIKIGDENFCETQGLGGRALEDAFKKQFIGMNLPVDKTGVDALSSATITTNAVIDAINAAYNQFLADQKAAAEEEAARKAAEEEAARKAAEEAARKAEEEAKKHRITILAQPKSVSAPTGQQVSVKVDAEGEGLTYVWYYKDTWETDFRRSSTAKNNVYTAEMNEARDGRQVYCEITNQYGDTVRTATATLTRDAAADAEAARKAAEEEAARKAAEEEAKRKAAEEEAARKAAEEEAKRKAAEEEAARKAAEEEAKRKAAEEEARKQRINILSQPADMAVNAGEQASVSVKAEGEGLTYVWYYKDTWETAFNRSNTAKGNTYSAEMNDARNGRQVYCVITNQYGYFVQTNTVTLSMIALPATTVDFPALDTKEGAPFIGKWEMESVMENGDTFYVDDMGGSSTLTLNADGSAVLTMDADAITLSWYMENGIAIMGNQDALVPLFLEDDGRLVMDMLDYIAYYVKDGNAAKQDTKPEPETDTPDPTDAIPVPGAEERMEKKYICTGFTKSGQYSNKVSRLGGEYSLIFHADGNVEFVTAGFMLPGATWTQGKTASGQNAFVIRYATLLYEAVLDGQGFTVDNFGTVLHFELVP